MKAKRNTSIVKRIFTAMPVFVLIAINMFISGCAHEMIVAKGPRYNASLKAKYMVLPFGDANDPKYRLKHQNAASVVRDALETAFLEEGFTVISCPEALSTEVVQGVANRGRVDLTTEQVNKNITNQHLETEKQTTLGKQGLTEGQAIEVGKRNGADLVLLGIVTAYYQGQNYGGFGNIDYTTVGFSVKAIDVGTGELAWKASLIRKVGFDYTLEPAIYTQKIAKELIGNLVDKK